MILGREIHIPPLLPVWIMLTFPVVPCAWQIGLKSFSAAA